jgi:hypothetical protein
MIVPHIGAIHGMETNHLWNVAESLSKKNPTNPLPWFGPENLFQCRIVTTNKLELKKVNYNHCNYSQLHLVV